jgi:integrase
MTLQVPADRPVSGHVFRVERTRGPVWYAKYRLPDGRQVQKKLGPAWTSRGRPANGYFTKRTAEDWLRDVLDQARRGTLPGLVRTGVTFAQAAEEYLHWLEHDRARKLSTLRDYRSIVKAHLLPALGDIAIEDLTPQRLERWQGQLGADRPLSNRTKVKIITTLMGVMKRAARVHRLPVNPALGLEKPRHQGQRGLEVFSPMEVLALANAAADEQDTAIFVVAAFTGLRMGELLALRWRDVDFAGQFLRVSGSYAGGLVTTPKSGRVRSVPLAPEPAQALARLGQRASFVGDDDLVFPNVVGEHLDGSALRRRYSWRCSGLACAICASMICATRSGRARSPRRRSCRSRSGWATPTCSTCTTRRGRRTLPCGRGVPRRAAPGCRRSSLPPLLRDDALAG